MCGRIYSDAVEEREVFRGGVGPVENCCGESGAENHICRVRSDSELPGESRVGISVEFDGDDAASEGGLNAGICKHIAFHSQAGGALLPVDMYEQSNPALCCKFSG